MRKIVLGGSGLEALVDDEDYPLLSRHAWHLANGYAQTTFRGKEILMHHLIMPFDGRGPRKHMDHVNGNGLDNRKENLRFATRAENMRNVKKRAGCSSRYKGVCRYRTGQWSAGIWEDGKRRHLGYFATQKEAAQAYDAAAKRLYGEFAKLNFGG